MEEGDRIQITWPQEAFILVLADSDDQHTFEEPLIIDDVEVGTTAALQDYSPSFTLSYQYYDRDPAEVIAAMSEEERNAYYDANREVNEEKITETWTFWLFIVGGVIGLILIVLLIICLVRLRQKNSLIVAKVEKLSTDQILAGKIPEGEKKDDFYESQRKAAKEQVEKEKMAAASSAPAIAQSEMVPVPSPSPSPFAQTET